jgi:polyhydroxybutyrate depolymerase
MACEAADRIASFTAVGDSVRPDACAPSRPVPLWTFTGDPDRYAVSALVDKWVAINGCDPDPVVEDLGSGVSRKTYQNCEADVVFYDIEGMGHVWPLHEVKVESPGAEWLAAYEQVDYLEDTLRFFAEHPLP